MAVKQTKPRIFAVANQKGGVGKTTTSVNLATALAACNKRVLLIDIDPQGNASTGLGAPKGEDVASTYNILFDDIPLKEVIFQTKVPKLHVAPSSMHLAGAEIELISQKSRERRLFNALRPSEDYDYIIIDCPPSLSMLTINAFVAAHAVIVPLQCEFYALEGLSQLLKTVKLVQDKFNKQLYIHGILLTMFDRRNRLSKQVAEEVRDHFGDQVYKTVIPRNVRLSEAPSYGLPAIIYDLNSMGAQAYIRLASEVIRREKQTLKSSSSNSPKEAA